MPGLRDLKISARRRLPARLLSVRFARSGGPGGQHVNKVSSKVDLRLDLAGAAAVLGETDVKRLRTKLAARLDGAGRVRVVSQAHREQARNLETALAKMEALLREALLRPKKRRATKPTRASRERRLAEKKRRSRIKQWRSDSGSEA